MEGGSARRPLSAQWSAASGDQPPKSALDKLDTLFDEVMRKGVCSMDQDMRMEIMESIHRARLEISREQVGKSWKICRVVTVGGLIGYIIRKCLGPLPGEKDGKAGRQEMRKGTDYLLE
uniref:Uncharacterized protein n=1 Tax=Leersia perrieri TaxID=77586 RepID=A0A0D9VBM8_9ORYZ